MSVYLAAIPRPAPGESLIDYAARLARTAAEVSTEARMLRQSADSYAARAAQREAYAADLQSAAELVPQTHAVPVVEVVGPPAVVDVSPTEARYLDVIGGDTIDAAEVVRRIRSEYGIAVSIRRAEDDLARLAHRGLVRYDGGWMQ